MSQDTKSFVPTFLALAGLGVVAVVAVNLLPSSTKTEQNERKEMTLSVDWLPKQKSGEVPNGRTLKDEVIIEVSIGRTTGGNIKESATKSPWTRVIHPRGGQTVELRASQVYGNQLGCIVSQVGQPDVFQRKSGPVTVICIMKSL